MNRLLIFIFLILAFNSCKELNARRPITRSTGSYNQESINRNKNLIALEEEQIKKYILKDTLNTYLASNDGFWYTYITRDSLGSTITPQVGDLAQFTYGLKSLNDTELVHKEEIGSVTTQIDQSNQELISGIRDGLKIMKKGETVIFLFPSHKGYGYYGLEEKIRSNTTLICELTLLNIKQQ